MSPLVGNLDLTTARRRLPEDLRLLIMGEEFTNVVAERPSLDYNVISRL